ncbi:MAG: NADPH-dependent FMN reductase [Pseudomonadota bacterium]
MPTLKFVAISGSLRAASANTALLRAAVALAPAGTEIVVYDGVGKLPHFNPDLEAAPDAEVVRWQTLLLECDGVLIACPEYAHGVPGAFKNALDWVVGTVGLENLPVALINCAPRAVHAQAALAEIIATMGWAIVAPASVTIPVARKGVALAGTACEPQFAGPLRLALQTLADAANLG